MRYALLATTLLAMPASAQTTTASFAAPNCPGQTFYSQGDPSQWSFGGGGSLSDGNNAFASYQAPTQNQTEQASANGLTLSILPMPASNGAGWQAGLMNTQNTFKQTYGYYEIAVNLPPSMLQNGASWAFWLIGYQWPPEIDIAEFYGPSMDSAQHSAATSYNAPVYRYNVKPGSYVYAVDWEPDKITWYIDGQQTQQSDTPADFHQPMYIVLGSAATTGDMSAASMQVQYVRVFKDMQAALACVPNASGPSNSEPQISALTNQVQQASTQANQLQATIPTIQAQPPDTSQVPGYDPQFVQAGQQMQQQLSAIQSQIDAVQSQIQNFQLPQRPQ